MNLNIYLESPLYQALEQYAIKHKSTKNNVIRSAITKSLGKTFSKKNAMLSKEFIDFKGAGDDFEPFESYRSGLKKVDLSKSCFD